MLWVRVALTICLVTIPSGVVLIDSASAVVPDDVCQQARNASQKDLSPWHGVGKTGRFRAIKVGTKYNIKDLDKIIFIYTRDDQRNDRTVLGVKIIFHTQGDYVDQDWVRAQNNFRRGPVSVKYQDYQNFHNEIQEIFDLKMNFHLASGEFNTRIPFTTFEPADRRRQLLLPPTNSAEERTYRVYLLTFDGVKAEGSCVDFKPFFPSGTVDARIEIIDLLPETGSETFFHSSINFDLAQ